MFTAQTVLSLQSLNILALQGLLKDGLVKYMIEMAEKSGIVNTNRVFIEPKNGNIGIPLTFVCLYDSRL